MSLELALRPSQAAALAPASCTGGLSVLHNLPLASAVRFSDLHGI